MDMNVTVTTGGKQTHRKSSELWLSALQASNNAKK